jgi:antitoxin HicB
MVRTVYNYPAILEPDEDGRLLVHFPGLPEALTDGADKAEALREAADCLSEALASRIVDGEEIPPPTPLAPGQYLVSPDPTIALKAALYMALRQRDMTVADLAELLEMDWHLAARLIDPKRSSKLTSLAAALSALGCRVIISVETNTTKPSLSDATLRAVQAHGEGATLDEIISYFARQFGMTVRPNHLGVALRRHLRAGHLEKHDERWYPSPSAKMDTHARSGGARVKRN